MNRRRPTRPYASGMTRVTLTGATGLLGTRLVRALRERGDEVTVLSRNPERAREALRRRRRGRRVGPGRRAGARRGARRPRRRRAPRRRERRPALERRRQAPHPRLARAGHPQPRRGPARRRAAPGRARELLRRRLLRPARRRAAARGHPAGRRLPRRGLRRLGARGAARPRSSACASCACAPASCSTRTAARWARCCRSSRPASAARSPAASQLMPWIHADDVVGIYLRALDDEAWSRRGQRDRARSPSPTRTFSKALGRALHRPAVAPVPAFAIQLLYGEMSEIVTKGQNAVPRRTLELGYRARAPRPRRGAALRAPVGLTARYGAAGHAAGRAAIVRGNARPAPPRPRPPRRPARAPPPRAPRARARGARRCWRGSGPRARRPRSRWPCSRPARCSPADGARTLALAAASAVYRPTACDQPRGATFAAARPCAAPGTTDATPGGLARRLAVH